MNLLLCIALTSFGYTTPVTSIKSMVGIAFATLCPVLWNQWLYSEMFQSGNSNSLISCRSFLWIGFFIAFGTSLVLLLSFFRGTL